jgi:hypothetical protein
MATSKFQQAQNDYPMVASALNMFPPTRMAMGVGNVVDQASQDNASGVKDALLNIVPYGKTIGKAINGDLAGAAEDIALSKVPPLARKAYNYFNADSQEPTPFQDVTPSLTEQGSGGGGGGGGGGKTQDDEFASVNVMKRGGKVKAYAKGGAVSSKPAKSTRGRGDGIAQRGHTKGRIV